MRVPVSGGNEKPGAWLPMGTTGPDDPWPGGEPSPTSEQHGEDDSDGRADDERAHRPRLGAVGRVEKEPG